MKRQALELYFDGSCIKNPGGAMGFGAIIINLDKKTRKELSDGKEAQVGNTNNVAEYIALLMGLKELKSFKSCDVTIKGDSQLVINQISGDWKIKNKGNKAAYAEYAKEARELLKDLFLNNDMRFRFEWIPREENEDCDKLSNRFHSKADADYSDIVKNMGF